MSTKLFPRRVLFVLALVVLTFFSCQKLIDIIHAGDGGVEFKLCNIKKVTGSLTTDIQTYIVHYDFTYNSNGDPLRITNDLVGTGNPNYFFRYDKYHRLSQTIRPYTNGGYEAFSKYVYNNKNQILSDTQYIFGLMSGDTALSDPNRYAVTTYSYDAQNRITHTSLRIFHFGTSDDGGTRDYIYDASGNLPAAVHDNKLNINRTSKVWMFLTRDYSVNNAFIAGRYNLNNLPTVAPGGIELLPYKEKATIEYSCP